MDKLSRDEMAANYGFAMAFLRQNDELWKLFNQAVKGTWTADRFIAKLRNTDWFQKHSAAVRNAIMQETSDPATYQANVDQMYATVRDAYGAMFGKAGMNQKQLRQWAETAHRMGWSQAQLMDRITESMNLRKTLKSKALGGTAAELEGQVDALAKAYGIDPGKQWRINQIKRIVKGDDTLEGLNQRMREWAMREYKAFADSIEGGQTVADIAEPYIARMASLLEINPADVQITDKKIQAALKQKDNKGRPAAMDLADFADLVRSDKRWQYTDNAREEVSNKVLRLAQLFGTVA